MTNHYSPRVPGASWLLLVSAGAMLGGCVAAVVPIAAGGMLGKKAVFGHHSPRTKAADPAPAPVASPTPPARRATPSTVDDRSPPPAVKLVPPAPAEPPAAAPIPAAAAITTTWDGIARSMAKLAARVPDHLKADVLLPRNSGGDTLCGTRHTAVAVDAATLGSGDYLYLGAIYTMGLEVVLLSPFKTLPPGQVAALRKQGIATPVPGKTLFPLAPGAEGAARAALSRQYCVVGLIGNRAADFPNGVLPGTPGARDGWFLVRKPN